MEPTAPSTEVQSPLEPDRTVPEQRNAEEYEFDETHDFVNDTTDGMGALIANARKSGYTGPQAGIAALRFLQSMHSDETFDIDANYASSPSESSTLGLRRASKAEDVERMIHDYFTYFHPAYPLLHEGIFRARALAVSKPRDGSWPLVYNMVIAMGAFVGDSVGSNHDLEYYHLARKAISLDVVEKGSLCYVQGLMIMANYLQKRNKPNAGFALIGVAWSMALSIGLHREFGNLHTSHYTMELRRRAWWTLFVFVSNVQLTFGRPPASLIGINVSRPRNLADADLAVDMQSLPPSDHGATVTSSLIAQVELASIANDVQAELLSHQIPDAARVRSLDQQIVTWEATLPAYFHDTRMSPAKLVLPLKTVLWKARHLRISLNRPFLFRAIAERQSLVGEDQSIRTCIATARTCIEEICHLYERQMQTVRGYAWYATYWLVTASFVLAICLAYDPSHHDCMQWKVKLEMVEQLLRRLGSAHVMANRAQRLLSQVLSRYKSPQQGSAASGPVQPPFFDPLADADFSNFAFAFGQFGEGSAESLFDPIPPATQPPAAPDDPWACDPFANVEFMDATGGVTLRNHQSSWR